MPIESTPLLEIRNLETSFQTMNGEVRAVRGIDLSVRYGQIVGIVGESGSGKSVSMLSVVRLLDSNGYIRSGEILFSGENLARKNEKEMRKHRNRDIGMIFQDPMTSLNPTVRVSTQLIEKMRAFQKDLPKKDAWNKAVELLRLVKIPDPEKRMDSYPFELSGGMRQRLMIAIAIAMKPKLLIADEPTTALDVTIQNQILKLIKGLQQEIGSSVLLITHDLGVIAETCQRVVVMYGGKIMEDGLIDEIFHETAHPYTQGLKASLPSANTGNAERLFSIPGSPPSLLNPPKGCPFAARCGYAMVVCDREHPPAFSLSPTHLSACWLHHPGRKARIA